jgi:hypothetical protein
VTDDELPDDPPDLGGVWVGPDPGAKPGRTPPAPRGVVYSPIPPAPPADPRERELEAALLALCREDHALLARLVSHERERHPHLSRADLLDLALRHYRRDHS